MPKRNFLDNYGNLDPAKRADIILDHFSDFPSIIEGQKKILVLKIRNESDYLRKAKRDELGTVVLTSGRADPTAKQAVEHVYIEELVQKGDDISELIRGMESEEKTAYHRQFHILMKMQEEYAILEGQLMLMSSNDKKMFQLYSECGHDFQYIAEQEGIQYDSARRRIWKIRKKIKSNAIVNMSKVI